jgi:hypothetical protein
VALFAAGTFFRGYTDHKFVQGVVAQANEQIFLAQYDTLQSQLQLCIVSANGKVFQYLRTNSPKDAALVSLTLNRCDEWLDVLGKSAPDEKTSAMLGQARLFFNGFRESAKAIVGRQMKLEELYAKGFNLLGDVRDLSQVKKLEEEQSQAIPEFNKFTSAIFLAIVQATPSQPEAEE